MREMKGEVAELRHDVTMLRANLGDLHTEVVAIQDDIIGLRGASGSQDGGVTKIVAVLELEVVTKGLAVLRGEG